MIDLAHELAQIVGRDHVLVDADLTASYATDWTGRFAGEVALAVRPGDTAETAAVVAACASRRCATGPPGRQHRPRRRERPP